ncbi:MAG: flagellar basal-body rod protein FlgF [bacterium]|jgi:flagellar basal-body rod protein FlgG|nr:flagellar basal-body rod protein FlgF [Solirubrobacteraceae bacterium]
MERGLYIAASGMVSEMARQDLIANNLANASTPGYKSDRAIQGSFGDLLLSNTATGAQVGPLGLGSRIERQVTDMSAAPIRETGEPLDFAIAGDGFFAVQTEQGVRYTRNGQFAAAADGTLVDQRGNRVLGQGNQPVRVPADGKVDAAAVGIFDVPNARKVGDALLQGAAAGRGAGQVQAGGLEASGADPAKAMVDMIASLRAFESGQKVITTIDATLGKAANQVGALA